VLVIDEKDIAKLLRRRGALSALVTAGGIFAFLLIQQFLSQLIALGRGRYSGYPANEVATAWATSLAWAFAGPFAFAIGVFLCLWQVAPISPKLRLGHVVTRAALASILGIVVYWLVRFGIEFVGYAISLRSAYTPDMVGQDALDVLWSALSTLLSLLPLVVLGAILQWGWLQRHPPKHPVGGTLDEV
jgi:hypothetical protein